MDPCIIRVNATVPSNTFMKPASFSGSIQEVILDTLVNCVKNPIQ